MIFVYGSPYYLNITYPLVTKIKMLDVNGLASRYGSVCSRSIVETVVSKGKKRKYEEIQPQTLTMTIIVANANTSIRSFIENDYQDCGAMTLGRIYVHTNQPLIETQLDAVKDKLKEFPADMNLTGVIEKNKHFNYTTIEHMPSLRDTLAKYNKIHIHYSYASDGDYTFINMSSLPGCIDINEDVIEFSTLSDRNSYSSYHGHINFNGTVDIFQYLPLAFEYKCLKVPDGYQLTPNVCQIFRGNFVFYIISKVFLVSSNKSVNFIHNTKLDLFSDANIMKALEVFSEFGFCNVNIDQNCIYANDDNVLMVIGVISNQILGSFSRFVEELN